MNRGCFHLIASLCASWTFSTYAAVHYVDANSSAPASPYLSWATSANNIQDAVDASANGDSILVTNGVYNTGGVVVFGSMSNRVAVTRPLQLQSVNGPAVTIIQGYQTPTNVLGDVSVRCAYLTNGATLTGFTLTNGATRGAGDSVNEQSGGGLWCAASNCVVSNCVLTGNSAVQGGG